jgi:DNA-directed RNA polymerase subunit RPC12/RpoP
MKRPRNERNAGQTVAGKLYAAQWLIENHRYVYDYECGKCELELPYSTSASETKSYTCTGCGATVVVAAVTRN